MEIINEFYFTANNGLSSSHKNESSTLMADVYAEERNEHES